MFSLDFWVFFDFFPSTLVAFTASHYRVACRPLFHFDNLSLTLAAWL